MKYLTLLISGLLSPFSVAEVSKSTEFTASAEMGWTNNSALAVTELDDVSTGGDSGLMLKANLNGKWQVSEKLQLQSSYNYTNENYTDSDQYDLSIHLGSIDLGYKLPWFNLGIRHDGAIASLNGSRFLTFNQTSVYLAKLVGSSTFVRANSKIKTKQFAIARQRDADSIGVGVDAFYFLNTGDTMLNAGVQLEEESATDPQFDYTGVNINTKLAHNFSLLGKDSQLSVTWRYQKRDYNHTKVEPLDFDENAMNQDAKARQDSHQTYQLQWQINLLENLALKTEIEVGDFRSTQEQQTYGQTVTSISVEASF